MLISCSQKTESQFEIVNVIDSFEEQLNFQLHLSDSLRTEVYTSPRSIKNGKIKMSRLVEWTSGFFPGELWMMYKYTKETKWKNFAEDYTSRLAPMQFNRRTHDLGFMMFCSYGRGYSITHNEKYKSILLQSAESLIGRFNPTVGCIRSWDHAQDKWEFPVIIDNIMNLELLYWASKISGDSKYKDIANKHALTTLKNHFRRNGSCYHVVDYDPTTGEVRKKNTAQGYSDDSSWARGQAWALYGYTMCYRETGIPAYLRQAQKVASFIINHGTQAEDPIPYWDYDVPNQKGQPRDASSAAIIASALLELQTFVNNDYYLEYARKLLKTLASPQYMAEPYTNQGFVLKHSTGSVPHRSEIDTPIIYADYYFLEALLKLKQIDENKN